MANWGASSVVTISASNTTYVSNSSINTIVDSFNLPQAPRRINSSALNQHLAINTNVNNSIAMISPYISGVVSSIAFRVSSTFNNGVSKSYIPYNRRPVRGQVYPR